jgi:hypothetical protein
MSAARAGRPGATVRHGRVPEGRTRERRWSDAAGRPRTRAAALGFALAGSLAAPAVANGQPARGRPSDDIAQQVARAGDAIVRFEFAVRAGVCGDGRGSVTIPGPDGTSRHGMVIDGPGQSWAAARCEPGPGRVTLTVRDGMPRSVRFAVGPARPLGGRVDAAERTVDLGPVPAPAAAAYLLDLAARPDAPPPSRAVLAAAVADSAVVWPRLLGLARDSRPSDAARREATFWAGQYACDAVAAAHPAPARADTADREVRRQVVFALSQQRAAERTAPLVRVAETDRDPAVRCAALFWLGQGGGGTAGDTRVLDLYERVLRGR